MTKVLEVTAYQVEHEGTHDQVVGKLVALGWEVVNQELAATTLHHELIPGGQRIVLQPQSNTA